MTQKKSRGSNFIFLTLSIAIIYSCSSQPKKIEYQKACQFKKVNGKEILICDEEQMNKVKVYTNPYTKDFIICDKFIYNTEIDGQSKEETGIRCKTNYGYEIIK